MAANTTPSARSTSCTTGTGRPVPVGRTVLPPALAERCTDPRLPAVRPSCADDVLDVLRGD